MSRRETQIAGDNKHRLELKPWKTQATIPEVFFCRKERISSRRAAVQSRLKYPSTKVNESEGKDSDDS